MMKYLHLLGLGVVLSLINAFLYPTVDIHVDPKVLEMVANNPLIWLFIIMIGAPIVEEILFRGILYGMLEEYMDEFFVIFLVTIIFAMAHFAQQGYSLEAMVYGLIISFILTIIRYKENSLLPSMFLHVSLNISATILIIIQGMK